MERRSLEERRGGLALLEVDHGREGVELNYMPQDTKRQLLAGAAGSRSPWGGVRDRVWDKRERGVRRCFVVRGTERRERALDRKKKEGQETRDNPKLPTTRLVSLETVASWLLLSPADLVTGFVFLSGRRSR